jgi:hypothetical protein
MWLRLRAAREAIVVGGDELLRDAHRPRVDDDLLELVAVEAIEPGDDPVVPHVALFGHDECVGPRLDERNALLLGNAKPIIESSRLKARNTMLPTRNFTRSRTTAS